MPEVMNSEILLLSDHANKFCFGMKVLSNYFVIGVIFSTQTSDRLYEMPSVLFMFEL